MTLNELLESVERYTPDEDRPWESIEVEIAVIRQWRDSIKTLREEKEYFNSLIQTVVCDQDRGEE